MIDATLWNVGAKVASLDSEVTFFEALGGRLLATEPPSDGDGGFSVLEFGGTRLLLTPTPIFEKALEGHLRPGLTHIVFEVTGLDDACAQAVAAGARTLVPARHAEAAFGTRELAFFQSPGGTVFELMRIIENRI